MSELRTDTKQSIKEAYSVGTRKNLKTQWKAFLLFCRYFNLIPLPCDVNTVCLFAQFLSRSFNSVESIKNYVYGVKFLHLLLDLEFNHFESFYFKLFMKGLKRCNPHSVKTALPITPDILQKIKHFLDFSDENNYTFWCLFLFGFYLMCRKSNLVGSAHEQHKCLKRGDIKISDDYLTVKFTWSKTIQFGERKLEIPITKNPSEDLCAYKAFQEMKTRFPVKDNTAAFVVKIGNKIRPVTYYMMQKALRSSIAGIGLNPSDYSTHSLRRGGATFAFKSGVSAELIQVMGDWKSDAYKIYLQHDFQDKLKVSKMIMTKT